MTQILLLLLFFMIAGWMVWTYNRFVKNKNLMQEAWSGIDVQLKRRYDLIPNLVEVVKGYSQHERTVLEEITRIRTECINASTVKGQQEAENKLTQNLKSLIAVSEAYPDLKANQNFLELQRNLTEIEDTIQMARRYYNGMVRIFNILIQSFPNNILAIAFGFKPAEFFEIELATQRNLPEVNMELTK